MAALRLDPWSETDRSKILSVCKDQGYEVESKKDADGNVVIDLEDPKNNKINRRSFMDMLRTMSVKFEIGRTSVMEEKMDLLQELVGLSEAKKKKPCCKKCVKKATPEMYEELHMSTNVAESLAKIFGQQLNESKDLIPKSFHIAHDLEDHHSMAPKIAKALGIHDHGHPIKVAPGLFGTYLYGAGLSFYHDLDHIPHDDDHDAMEQGDFE